MTGNNFVTTCGYVSLLGRANVGKSTLLNRLVGRKLAPTADKPQTTRHRLQGIVTRDGLQMIFVDTPGVHFGHKRLLNKSLNRNAAAALNGVDVLMLVVECPHWGAEEEHILKLMTGVQTPLVVCINKLDAIKDKLRLLPYISLLSDKSGSKEIIPVSARTGENVPTLTATLATYLPQSPLLFPEGALTDRDDAFVIAELIREQLTRQLSFEVPHAVYVEVDSLEQTNQRIGVAATIWVERETQKAIVIGK
ncbi:MAG: GTPase Era, partial [Gammaproteobacteria bacterium]